MKICIWCGKETKSPLKDLWEHFKPLDIQRCKTIHHYVKGNIVMSGSILRGLIDCFHVISPLANSLAHYKYRKHYLIVPAEFEGKK